MTTLTEQQAIAKFNSISGLTDLRQENGLWLATRFDKPFLLGRVASLDDEPGNFVSDPEPIVVNDAEPIINLNDSNQGINWADYVIEDDDTTLEEGTGPSESFLERQAQLQSESMARDVDLFNDPEEDFNAEDARALQLKRNLEINRQHIEELSELPNQGRDGLDVYDEDYTKPRPINSDDGNIGSGTGDDVDIVNSNASGQTTIRNSNIFSNSNPLDDYVNYTYNIDLYMVNKEGYRSLIDNPKTFSTIQKELIISSGGKREGRSALFGEDFYIDDLEVDSILPMTETTRGTLEVMFSFTITEPYGMTLLERMAAVAENVLRIPPVSGNFTQLPYILRISFVGYDDNGKSRRIYKDKFFIVKILEMKFEVNEGGATYKVKAYPYGHASFDPSLETLPSAFETHGETVNDLIASGRNVVINERKANPTDPFPAGPDTIIRTPSKTLVGTLADFMNRQQRELTKTDNTKTDMGRVISDKDDVPFKDVQDTIKIIVHPDIGTKKIRYDNIDPMNILTDKNKENPGSFYSNFVKSVQNKFEIAANSQNKTVLRLTTGTSLIETIGTIIIHSDYIYDQFKNKSEEPTSLNWFTISPVITSLGEWSTVLQRYAYNVTYYVKPYLIDNITIKTTDQKSEHRIPTGKLGEKNFHKIYEYIYTGKNQNLLDFDIKYNIAYQTVGSISKTRGDDAAPTGSNVKGVEGAQHSNQSTRTTPMEGKNTGGKAGIAKELVNNVLTNGIDLFTLKATIVGDPDYIVQNEVWNTDTLADDVYDQPYFPDGTINLSYSPIYVKIDFRTPVDYNANTGAMDFYSKSQFKSSTVFSGTYQLWKVKNKFEGGEFKQELFGNRILDKTDPPEETTTASVERDYRDREQNNRGQRVSRNIFGRDKIDTELPRQEIDISIFDSTNNQTGGGGISDAGTGFGQGQVIEDELNSDVNTPRPQRGPAFNR
jgi:hypothetical protein